MHTRGINKDLFYTFFILGISTFGGGYAMIALIEQIVVDRKGWLTQDELLDIIAVSQATPGAIAINTATYIGKRTNGIKGAIIASTGVILPSFLIISFLYPLLVFAFNNPKFNSIFLGIQIAVTALISSSVISIFSKGIKGVFAKIIFALSLLIMILFSINPIWLIITGAILGLIYAFVGGDR
jgi:chromate transporter